MRVTCPACHAETSLEVLLGREADARAVATFLEHNLALGDVLLRYIALFRPEKRRLGLARMVGLLQELQVDIERGAITRKGRDWEAPKGTWRAAAEVVLSKRDKGTLTLPLTSHGLLYEVLCGLSEKAEAQAEAQAEEERRQRRQAGPAEGPRELAPLAALNTTAPAAPPRAYAGPSRAARALKAQMDAAMRQRSGALATPPDDTTGEPAP